MRIRVLSDLHLEESPWSWVPKGEDVCVLAGDIVNGVKSVRFERFWNSIKGSGIDTVYVPGNHERYGRVETAELPISGFGLPKNVKLLERRAVDINGVRFLGCTLWTDFSFVDLVKMSGGRSFSREQAIDCAEMAIPDFSALVVKNEKSEKYLVTADDMTAWHKRDKQWLDEQIGASPLPVVVVTHFLPGPGSIGDGFQGNPLNPYFCTDCRSLMRKPVVLWIHGHTHASIDYVHNGVRVVCNPRGYVYADGGDTGNRRFKSDCMVEI